MSLLKILLLCSVLVTISDAYRILAIFPIPSADKQRFYNYYTSKLCNNGHEVVVITSNAKEFEESDNMSVIDVQNETEDVLKKHNKGTENKEADIPSVEANEIFKVHYKSRKVQDLVNNDEKFDLLLVDGHFPTSLVLTQVFDLPVVMIHDSPDIGIKYDRTFGNIKNPIFNSSNLNQSSIWNIISMIFSKEKNRLQNSALSNKVLKELFGKNTPPFEELYDKVELVLHNANTIWDINRPLPTGLMNIKGIDRLSNENITEYLSTYLDSAKNGIIFSNIDTETMNKGKIAIILDVISKLPYDVLLKWPTDNLDNKPKNVYLYKVLPRADILRHPNIKVFITHGDSKAVTESLEAKIPIIIIPKTNEDKFNAEMVVRHDVGVRIDPESLGMENFEEALTTVCLSERYRNNAIKVGQIMTDHPRTVEERAIWWTEYVVRHQGTSHLRSPSANITWSEYLVLDVMGILLTIVLVILVLIGVMLKVILMQYSKKTSKVKYEEFWTVLPTHRSRARFN